MPLHAPDIVCVRLCHHALVLVGSSPAGLCEVGVAVRGLSTWSFARTVRRSGASMTL